MHRLTVVLLSIFLIQACGGGSSSPPTPPPANIAPTVNAGDDQTVDEQTEVTLTGTAIDSDGSIATYAWVQTAGTSVSITNDSTPTASFDAPAIGVTETLTFQLTATDNDGATASDTVNIAVVSTNAVPTADAGMDQSVNEQVDNVALSAANSTDSDGTIVDFEWTQISGTAVTLGPGINSASVTFTSPTLTVAEVLTFSVLVTDDGGATASDTVEITVFPVNQPPTAEAGESQAVNALVSVTLDGSLSSDSDGTIDSYQWTQISGTPITLTGATSAIATFTSPDVATDETLNFQLLVTDNEGEGRTDTVTISVLTNNTPPTAHAGNSQFRISGDVVSLDAGGSFDNETSTDTLTFSWQQTDNTGVSITLEDGDTAFPFFTAPSLTAARTFIFEVTVTDPGSKSDSSPVSIAVQPVITEKSNDTGIVTCGDYAWDEGGSGVHENDGDCSQTMDEDGDQIPAEQDGHFGRDVTASDGVDGHAGFSFTKLDANGDPLDWDAVSWSCVLDNTTKLVWEVKVDGVGLQDYSSTYTWYNTDTNTNGGNSGTQNGGVCTGSDCDTQGYVTAVNAMNSGKGLCGITSWKMPTREQLGSIVDYHTIATQAIDHNFFPNSPDGTWSSEPSAKDDVYAWIINFVNGKSLINGKNNSNANGIRLVYDGQCLNGC